MDTSARTAETTAPLRVFVVEDSPLIRERIDVMLAEISGARSIGHADGAQDALRGILELRPDVVLLDLKLAQGNGFDVLRVLHEAAPGIDVYVLSSLPGEPYRRIAERFGAREYFDKTTEFESFRRALSVRAVRH